MRKQVCIVSLLAVTAVFSAFAGLVLGAEMRGAIIGGKQGANVKAKDTVTVTGTVVFVDLEGGFWGIMGDDGRRYDPGNLAKELRKQGLRVKMQGKPRSDAVSIRMWGQLIEVLSITPLEGTGPPRPAK